MQHRRFTSFLVIGAFASIISNIDYLQLASSCDFDDIAAKSSLGNPYMLEFLTTKVFLPILPVLVDTIENCGFLSATVFRF